MNKKSWEWLKTNHDCTLVCMTTLLTHTVAYSTKPSFMPKTNNQPPKKCLSLALSWAKFVKNGKIFKVNFLCQKISKKHSLARNSLGWGLFYVENKCPASATWFFYVLNVLRYCVQKNLSKAILAFFPQVTLLLSLKHIG